MAIECLKVVSYFRLDNYFHPMESDKILHIFKPNSYFENAVDLYEFDRDLRELIFTAIQAIEIALRSKMIHHISLRYGAFWFTNFDDMNNGIRWDRLPKSFMEYEIYRLNTA